MKNLENILNIFYLDKDPEIAASYHCKKHTIKMILESFQILSTTHRLLSDDVPDIVYKVAHKNHPSTKWARESSQHYKWLYELARHLSLNYTKHYNKHHLTWIKLGELLKDPPKNLQDNGFVDPPQCMPDHCKKLNTVEAYREYYRREKRHIAFWNSEVPYWYF